MLSIFFVGWQQLLGLGGLPGVFVIVGPLPVLLVSIAFGLYASNHFKVILTLILSIYSI